MRPSATTSRNIKTTLGTLILSVLLFFTSHASAIEKHATIADSSETKWSAADNTNYHDAIRQTTRLTYTDAGIFPPVSADITGDENTDLIFFNQRSKEFTLIPYIPYGSSSEEIIRPLKEQEESLNFKISEIEDFSEAKITIFIDDTTRETKIAISSGKDLFIVAAKDLKNSGELPVQTHIVFPEKISSISGLRTEKYLEDTGLAVSTNHTVFTFAETPTVGKHEASHIASKQWNTPTDSPWTINAVGRVLTESKSTTLALSSPQTNTVYLLPSDSSAESFEDESTTINSAEDTSFGASIVRIDDTNGDNIDDLAIGAPTANDDSGAVAIIYGQQESRSSLNVDFASTDECSIKTSTDCAGVILRQAGPGKLGASLAFIPGKEYPGSLIAGRPHHKEKPGAIIISSLALTKNWNTGRGIDDIPASQTSVLVSEKKNTSDNGIQVGTIPAKTHDSLTGIYTADSHQKVDLWTVDLPQQNTQPSHEPIEPTSPRPEKPTTKPGLEPLDSENHKIWLGEFSDGLGASLARGKCDVTGDGRSDIISSSPLRSEWVFDPYYADSTPTKGWVQNVTGQVQIIPAGTPGIAMPNQQIITINGPGKDDASIGLSVSCAGDVNKDNTDDIIVGSHTLGKIWVIFGGSQLSETDLNHLDPHHGYEISLPQLGAPAFQVTRVGDYDGDGLADIGFIISNARVASGDNSTNSGAAFIVRGHQEGNIDLTQLTIDNPDVLLRIDQPVGHTMNAFAPLGDVNGDHITDYAVSDYTNIVDNHVTGAVWVVYGAKNLQKINLENSFPGYRLEMTPNASYRLGAGTSIASAGDLDNDGKDEFVVGFDGGSSSPDGTEGGIAIVYSLSEQDSSEGMVRMLDPHDESKSDPRIRMIHDVAKDSGLGYSSDVYIDKDPSKTKLAVGAWRGDGQVYLMNLSDIPVGSTSLKDMGDAITTYRSAGEKARFGRSVIFSNNFLDGPTLVAGGDGVIDEDDHEGYAHTAHIQAIKIQ